MSITEDKKNEHIAIDLLKRYGKLLLKKHHRDQKRDMLRLVKEIAMELVSEKPIKKE